KGLFEAFGDQLLVKTAVESSHRAQASTKAAAREPFAGAETLRAQAARTSPRESPDGAQLHRVRVHVSGRRQLQNVRAGVALGTGPAGGGSNSAVPGLGRPVRGRADRRARAVRQALGGCW